MILFISLWLVCGIVATGIMHIFGYDESIDYTVVDMMTDFICVFFGPMTLLFVSAKCFNSYFSHVVIIKGKRK